MAEKTVSATVTIGGHSLPILYAQGGLEVVEDFDTASVRFSLVTDSSGSQVSVNDVVSSIVMGYSGDTDTVMTDGYIDSVTADRPPGAYTIEGRDKLKLAADYFIVAASLDEEDFFNPRSDYGHTAPHAIVNDILAECGLTGLDASSGDSGWELGTEEDGTPFQLVSAWDAIQQICVIGVWKTWVHTDGTIEFAQVVPEPGTPSGSLTTGDGEALLSISYSKSDENLRNKIVVIGANGEYTATVLADSPYLPTGFYKTAVISTDLIDSDERAASSASLNLDKFNKLTEGVTFEAEGDASVHVQDTLTITEAFTGVSGDWFISQLTHTIDGNGYRMSGTGVK